MLQHAAPPKSWYQTTSLCDVITQKTMTWTLSNFCKTIHPPKKDKKKEEEKKKEIRGINVDSFNFYNFHLNRFSTRLTFNETPR
jgi:hypothetical protein